MQKLCDLFARMVGQPVTNETGLAGVFSFTLDWAPDETQKLGAPEDGPPPSGASLFAAVQEQLGLRLEGRKGPVDVLVVDRMEKSPTEN